MKTNVTIKTKSCSELGKGIMKHLGLYQ